MNAMLQPVMFNELARETLRNIYWITNISQHISEIDNQIDRQLEIFNFAKNNLTQKSQILSNKFVSFFYLRIKKCYDFNDTKPV